MKNYLLFVAIAMKSLSLCAQEQAPMVLQYDKPATYFSTNSQLIIKKGGHVNEIAGIFRIEVSDDEKVGYLFFLRFFRLFMDIIPYVCCFSA